MAKADLTAARLRELYEYDPDTGLFKRLTSGLGRGNKVGNVAGGHTGTAGYFGVRADGAQHYAHRLAWLYMTGEWPSGVIDHLNGIRDDNRFANLRDVPQSVNVENQRRARTGTESGLFGVTRNCTGWQARIKVDGVTKCLGTYRTPEEANAVYLEAKRRLHSGCTI